MVELFDGAVLVEDACVSLPQLPLQLVPLQTHPEEGGREGGRMDEWMNEGRN